MELKKFEAVTFGGDAWRAVVDGDLQRPEFNSKGAALAFGVAVARGVRKAEPAVIREPKQHRSPVFENGFWWWYDPTRKGWFAGCAPALGVPTWARQKL